MNRGSAVLVDPPRDGPPRSARRPASHRVGDGPGAHDAHGRPAGERAGDTSWRPIGRLHRACAEARPGQSGREGAGAAPVASSRLRWAAAGRCRTRHRHGDQRRPGWPSARRRSPARGCAETLRRGSAQSRRGSASVVTPGHPGHSVFLVSGSHAYPRRPHHGPAHPPSDSVSEGGYCRALPVHRPDRPRDDRRGPLVRPDVAAPRARPVGSRWRGVAMSRRGSASMPGRRDAACRLHAGFLRA